MIATTFVNMAISTAILRDQGVLKRMQGTPLPRWAYVAARIGSTLVIVLLMTVITLALGALAYNVHVRALDDPRADSHAGAGDRCVHHARDRGHALHPERGGRPGGRRTYDPAVDVHLEHLVPCDGMPKALSDIAKFFPIRALADGLEHAFDPRTAGAGFNGQDLQDPGDLDRCRDLRDAEVPASPAGRGAMSFGSGNDCDRPDHAPAGWSSARASGVRRPCRHWSRPARGPSRSPHRWLAFIVFPLVNAVGKQGSGAQEVLVIAGAAVFVASYVAIVLHWRGRPNRLTLLVFVVDADGLGGADDRAVVGLGLPVHVLRRVRRARDRQAGFGRYVVALAPCSPASPPPSPVATDGACRRLRGELGRDRDVDARDARPARPERGAQRGAGRARPDGRGRERERFARDLHDLLGHSLSVIALKAELAGRLLDDGPHDAANEIAELEQVARTALGEVRDAVSGYRQPTLDRELAGARMALSAAGIEADVHEAHVPLDPPVEAVLAWAVREGATNVIRHSRRPSLHATGDGQPQRCRGRGDRRRRGDGAGGGTHGVDTVIGGARGVLPGVGTETRARAGAVDHLPARACVTGTACAGRCVRGPRPRRWWCVGGHGLAGLAERARLAQRDARGRRPCQWVATASLSPSRSRTA